MALEIQKKGLKLESGTLGGARRGGLIFSLETLRIRRLKVKILNSLLDMFAIHLTFWKTMLPLYIPLCFPYIYHSMAYGLNMVVHRGRPLFGSKKA